MEEKNIATEEKVSLEPAKKTSSEDYFADFNFGELETSMGQMLKNGVHFGHQKTRKNPKMEPYIFTTKNGINIIDLEKTVRCLEEAAGFLNKIKKEGKQILFVGTKKQIKEILKSAAIRGQMPYVAERWLGGTFTNFKIIRGRTKYLIDLENGFASGEFKKYTKFERMKKMGEMKKLEKKLGGIKNMAEIPAAVFVTDTNQDNLAVKEARRMHVPLVAIVDTNSDPSVIDYPIPGNDDAISSVRLLTSYICKAIVE